MLFFASSYVLNLYNGFEHRSTNIIGACVCAAWSCVHVCVCSFPAGGCCSTSATEVTGDWHFQVPLTIFTKDESFDPKKVNMG